MKRWFFLVIIMLVLAGGITPTTAQDSAADRILAAFQGYEAWDSYKATVSENSSYALTADGYQVSFWERQNHRSRITAWYDSSNSIVAITVSSTAGASTSQSNPASWTINLDAALDDGVLSWRGNYQASPTERFSLPSAWTEFTLNDIADAQGLSHLALSRYLRQTRIDPFVGDYAAWLNAAVSIQGPTSFTITRTTRADRYVIELDPADVPDVINSRLQLVSAEDVVLSSLDPLLDSLYENSRILWYVMLDPTTGALVGQQIQITLAANLAASVLQDPYDALNFEGSTDQSVVFTNINEAVPANLLPPG